MTIGWHFDNTYSKLSNTFKEEVKPTPVHNPELVVLNDQLAKDLNLDFSKIEKKRFISNIFWKYFTKRIYYYSSSICRSSIWTFYYAWRW
jgi:uncharacterized protein YdiU (UPF0061 family)